MTNTRTGRALSAAGAVIMVLGLFLTWYHADRPINPDISGWEIFLRLRWVILGGAALLLISAVIPQSRFVLVGRLVLGLGLAALVFRRIVAPPDVSAPLSTQLGVYVTLIGAICGAAGGVVDSGREVVERHPEFAFWRPPAGELESGDAPKKPTAEEDPPSPGPQAGGAVSISQGRAIDSTAEEI